MKTYIIVYQQSSSYYNNYICKIEQKNDILNYIVDAESSKQALNKFNEMLENNKKQAENTIYNNQIVRFAILNIICCKE